MNTKFDVVIFGATSFVGKILCAYLMREFGTAAKPGARKLSWAVAGRSKAKLQDLLAGLGPAAADIPVIIADAADDTALKEMCKQTRVVVSTVGPYALYGEPLIRACVQTGTDYCDLTGEPQWIRRMIGAYAEQAAASGARIVHCCGFDSIPSDLGVWFLQQQAMTHFGEPCTTVKMRVKAMRGAASGGTVASMVN
ncbi:MAG: saccharopine dehydrogenase family protein, partial [Burkholderiales bacterium]